MLLLEQNFAPIVAAATMTTTTTIINSGLKYALDIENKVIIVHFIYK